MKGFIVGVMMQVACFGFWESRVSEEMVVESAVRFGDVVVDRGRVYWSEGRPEERGRCFIVGEEGDVTGKEYNVRTRVHEYGGGSFCMKDGEIYFSNYDDQALYRLKEGKVEIWAEGMRYADGCVSDDAVFCVAEEGAVNRLVRIDRKEKGKIDVVHEGYDFYAAPRLSPDGKKIVFFAWNQPNMPWDGTDLLLSDFETFDVIAGGIDESVIDPKWSPEGELYFCSDRTGWWNLYRWDGEAVNVCPMEAEIGFPLWVFGESLYTFVDGEIYVAYKEEGISHLGKVVNGKVQEIKLGLTYFSHLQGSEGKLYFYGAGSEVPNSLFSYEIATEKKKTLRKGQEVKLKSDEIAHPEAISFPTTDGKEAYGFYYPPTNPKFSSEGAPPVLINVHGGPTSAAPAAYNIKVQYWTSRGFAFFDLNYGGSTGYGTEYRKRLNGNWGKVDLDDSVHAVKYLSEKGLADESKAAIRGGSAGGYTTLAALAFSDVFAAGGCYYGLSDLEMMVDDDHKFEARYSDKLVGPYPEKKELYRERSPIHYVDQITAPVIVFHGDEDAIVPPSQAEVIVDALRARNIQVPYFLFKGEQHGFRIAENIKTAHREELKFYQEVFK